MINLIFWPRYTLSLSYKTTEPIKTTCAKTQKESMAVPNFQTVTLSVDDFPGGGRVTMARVGIIEVFKLIKQSSIFTNNFSFI